MMTKMTALAERLSSYRRGHVLPEVEFFREQGDTRIVLLAAYEYEEDDGNPHYALQLFVDRMATLPGEESVHPQWSTEIISKSEMLLYLRSDEGVMEVERAISEIVKVLE